MHGKRFNTTPAHFRRSSPLPSRNSRGSCCHGKALISFPRFNSEGSFCWVNSNVGFNKGLWGLTEQLANRQPLDPVESMLLNQRLEVLAKVARLSRILPDRINSHPHSFTSGRGAKYRAQHTGNDSCKCDEGEESKNEKRETPGKRGRFLA